VKVEMESIIKVLRGGPASYIFLGKRTGLEDQALTAALSELEQSKRVFYSDGVFHWMGGQVRNKTQNMKMWLHGCFGNRILGWKSIDEWRASPFKGNVVLRYRGGVGGKWCCYDVDPSDVDGLVAQWVAQGAEQSRIYLNESTNTKDVLLQGELWNGGDEWNYFYHSWAKALMRDALRAAPEHSWGLKTEFMLRSTMTPSSYSDLQELRTHFPSHVFEISIYRVNFGGVPGRNATVWEVREY
jgi:hypothetical protein